MIERKAFGGQSRLEHAANVVDRLRALGVKLSPSCRLMQMKRVLERGVISSSDADFSVALESMRDLQHIGFALDVFESHPETSESRELLRRLITGCTLPQNDATSSPGRNSQFEVYLAAVCHNAGLHPVRFEEPDVVCSLRGKKWGIAAKRIKSQNMVEQHLKIAAEQICRSGHMGTIMLDVSSAWNSMNEPSVSRARRQLYPLIVQSRADELVQSNERILKTIFQKTSVRAVAIFDFAFFVRDDGHWEHHGMMVWTINPVHDPMLEQEFELFYGSFLSGFPILIDYAEVDQ